MLTIMNGGGIRQKFVLLICYVILSCSKVRGQTRNNTTLFSDNNDNDNNNIFVQDYRNYTRPCNICPTNDYYMSSSMNIIPETLIDFFSISTNQGIKTCFDLKQLAQLGETFTISQCVSLRNNINLINLCGCISNAPSNLSPESITIPSTSPTLIQRQPTFSSLSDDTNHSGSRIFAPSSSPTNVFLHNDSSSDDNNNMEYIFIESSITIRLFHVSEPMRDTTMLSFISLLDLFIEQQWLASTDMILCKKVILTMLNQTMIFSKNNNDHQRRRHRLLRNLEDNNSNNKNASISTDDQDGYFPLDTNFNITIVVQQKSITPETNHVYTLKQQSNNDVEDSIVLNITDIFSNIIGNGELLIHNLQYDKSIRSYFMRVHQIVVIDANNAAVPSPPSLENQSNTTSEPTTNTRSFFWTSSAASVLFLMIITSRYIYLHHSNKVDDCDQSYLECAPPPLSSLTAYGREDNEKPECSPNDDSVKSRTIPNNNRSNWMAFRYCSPLETENSEGSETVDDEDDSPRFHTIKDSLTIISNKIFDQSKYMKNPKLILDDYENKNNNEGEDCPNNRLSTYLRHTITNENRNSCKKSSELNAFEEDLSSLSSQSTSYHSHSRNVYLQLANILGETRLLTVNKAMPTEDSIYCLATVTVEAPPGRLGIVIDTTNDGPLVYHVLDDSPLLNKILPGDFMIGMNDVDTRSMSSNQLSDIIRQTSESYRMLTVLREIIDPSKMDDL